MSDKITKAENKQLNTDYKPIYRIMEENERLYTFYQNQQISGQAGLIGYLKGDFGTGEEFWTSWNDYSTELKTDDFKAEIDTVINRLRKDLLKDINALSHFCYSTPESAFNDNRDNYGVRLDTDEYSYLLRLNPNRGEYNFNCYCYRRDRLDSHLKEAEKGIRFIDSSYNEKFRIADGDKINIKLNSGETITKQCRYIDAYHLEVGSELYHICEFAEICEKNGHTVKPYREAAQNNEISDEEDIEI